MRWLLRLYPAAWRARYEDEILGFLEDGSITVATVVDLICGVIDAHRHYDRAKRGRGMSKRLAALAFLGALGLTALIKFLPTYPSSATGPSASSSFIVLGQAETGRGSLSTQHLSCTRPEPSTLTVTRGTVLAITCPVGIHVASSTRALRYAGRNRRGTTYYVLAYQVGHGTLRLDHATVTVTVRP